MDYVCQRNQRRLSEGLLSGNVPQLDGNYIHACNVQSATSSGTTLPVWAIACNLL